MVTRLGTVKDVPDGDMIVAKAGDREVLLVNPGTGIFALDNSCIHGGCRLIHGKLEGENLTCPCHGSVFNVRTGEVLDGPAASPQPTVAVTVKDGDIILA